MSANGGLYYEYFDSSSDIGAYFEIPTNTSTNFNYPLWFESVYLNWLIHGFYNETPNFDLIHQYNDHFLFISYDLLKNRSMYNFHFTFYLIQGWFDLDIHSDG